MTGVYRLKGAVKQYDWGGEQFLPALLQIVNRDKKPFAEYWMGIHPLATSLVETEEGEQPLSRYVPQLPFLLKVLDVKNMLSIQVHPSKEAAEKGYAQENEKGIPVDAAQRNFRDNNHKPELAVALGDFWLLHGFKPPEEMSYTLLNVVELRELLPVYNSDGYAGLYRHVMEMPQEEVNRILQPLIDNLAEIYKEEEPTKEDEDFWAAKAATSFNRDGNVDRGIFSIYLFNLVHLKKGEAIFQNAGVPHAYLEGQNVEIMASSDNVLRGGLTNKHVDVPALLQHIKCEATYPAILTGEQLADHENRYTTPEGIVTGFHLSVFELEAGDTVSFDSTGTTILVLTEGVAELDNDETTVRLAPGHPAAVVLGEQTVYLAAAKKSMVFRASAQ